jgi:hypothetical protein
MTGLAQGNTTPLPVLVVLPVLGVSSENALPAPNRLGGGRRWTRRPLCCGNCCRSREGQHHSATTQQRPHRAWRRRRDSTYDSIYAVPLRKKKDAAQWPALVARDSDGDGYSNGVELTFGSMPGRRNSHPSRSAAQLERWRAIIVRALAGKQIARLELDRRVIKVGADADGDRVPDVLEHFVGSDPRSHNSKPLVAACRLAVYRQLLLDAGVPIG